MHRLAPILALALAACGQRPDIGPVVASIVGAAPRAVDPAAAPLHEPDRLLLGAAAQGLVRFDSAGQIEPGLAERWIVLDGGLSYIFRLREAQWSDGRPVRADEVITVLRRQLASGSRNPLKPYLSAVDTIREMTPEVIEIDLSRPRPDLLKLFAQPEMAILRLHPPGGSGPMRVVRRFTDGALLRPVPDPLGIEDDTSPPRAHDDVRLIGEGAARAIVRFQAHQSDLVTGGTFADWPLVLSADPAPVNRRLDQAAGLFGLAITKRDGFLAEVANRGAVAQAIDREAIVAAFADEWRASAVLLPDQLDSAAPPTLPVWIAPPAPDLPTPRERVAAWTRTHPAPLRLSIALPAGPGATILFGRIAADLKRIGIDAVRLGPSASADLTLVDAVAPYDSARWYLATACRLCGEDAAGAIEEARLAPSSAARAAAIAHADAALAADIAFIPIARPLRWSLVALRLKGWQGNVRAWHPLNEARESTR